MAVKTMTVYEALQEKKLLEKRISGINFKDTLFITFMGENDDNVQGVSVEKAKDVVKGNFDSITQLIKNLAAYTAAISQSNATTKVKFDGKDYTVTEAIARYNNIDIEKKFLQTLVSQVNSTKAHVDKHNTDIKDPDKVSKYVNSVLGEKRTQDLIDATTKTYLANNSWILLDPSGLADKIQGKIDELNSFKERFHFVLTQSNATTSVEIELEN